MGISKYKWEDINFGDYGQVYQIDSFLASENDVYCGLVCQSVSYVDDTGPWSSEFHIIRSYIYFQFLTNCE